MDTPSPYRIYTVAGMTCDHCALSVREALAEVPGVSRVDVDLTAGLVTVAGAHFPDTAIAAAVADAGYELGA
jgi:copper chaperone